MMSFQLTDTVITAMCSAATNKTLCGVSFSWVQLEKQTRRFKVGTSLRT
jgi:hypothetical protein